MNARRRRIAKRRRRDRRDHARWEREGVYLDEPMFDFGMMDYLDEAEDDATLWAITFDPTVSP